VAEKESLRVLAEQECSQKHEQQRKAATDEMKEEVTHRNVSRPIQFLWDGFRSSSAASRDPGSVY
jgi:hypothetical protein